MNFELADRVYRREGSRTEYMSHRPHRGFYLGIVVGFQGDRVQVYIKRRGARIGATILINPGGL